LSHPACVSTGVSSALSSTEPGASSDNWLSIVSLGRLFTNPGVTISSSVLPFPNLCSGILWICGDVGGAFTKSLDWKGAGLFSFLRRDDVNTGVDTGEGTTGLGHSGIVEGIAGVVFRGAVGVDDEGRSRGDRFGHHHRYVISRDSCEGLLLIIDRPDEWQLPKQVGEFE
jgi:hypothetical protein